MSETNLPETLEVLDGGEYDAVGPVHGVLTPEEVLSQGGAALDGSNMCDIVRLRGSDGKYYVLTFEAVLSEDNPDDFAEWAKSAEYCVDEEEAYRKFLDEHGLTDVCEAIDTEESLEALAKAMGKTDADTQLWLKDRGYIQDLILPEVP